MTFWDDVKGGFITAALTASHLGFIADIFKRGATNQQAEELADIDVIQALTDGGIKNVSELFSITPNIVGMPLLNDLYSPGFGVLVRRKVSSTYQANLLSPMDYVAYANRYPAEKLDLTYYLSELGYNEKHKDILDGLYKYYPNPQDFVRFGVREVFKPDIVTKYGYDKEFPPEIKPYMHRAGLTDEVMSWFWRAHWELPSFYSIREAVWREEITGTELDEWLMANDYAPYWRDKLKKIIYKPYTRVDIRRMYDTDVLIREEVKKAYKDIGYDALHAEALTEFTIRNSDKTKDVLSTYTKAFKKGIITESELTDQMRIMEYSDKEIELRINLLGITTVADRPKRGLTLTNVKKLFIQGLIDTSTLEDMLIKLNYDDDAVKYMKLLILSDSEPHRVWTSEIKKGYATDILSRDEAISKLTSIGYSMEAIDLSLTLIDIKREAKE